MSFKKTLIGASALVIVAAAMPAAQASTPPTTLYGGGGTLAAKLYRDIFNCYSTVTNGIYSTSPGNVSTIASYPATRNAACATEASTAASGHAFAYEPVGSGAGLNAFTNGNPTSFGTPATSNPVAYINSSVTVGASSTPYPEVEFASSDAYMTAAQLSAASTVTPSVSAGYSNFFEMPTLGTPITLPVGQVSGVALTVKNVCDIFSGQAIIAGGPKVQTVVVRADGSGTSFIFSNFLSQNCTGTGAQGKTYAFTSANGFPSTLPSWSVAQVGTLSALEAASGSGGIAASVAATSYAIGYDSPDYVQPIVTSIAAYPASVNSISPSYNAVVKHLAAIPSTAYGTSFTNGLAATVNNLLASPAYTSVGYAIVGYTFLNVYGCYSSSYAGGKIGNAAKGAALKTALAQNFLTSGGEYPFASKILSSSGFAPLATAIQTVLTTTTGPLATSAAYGINGTAFCGTLH